MGRPDALPCVVRHPIHGDSEVVRDGLCRAAASRLGVFEGADFRITIAPSEADAYLKGLPGTRGLHESFARVFLHRYTEYRRRDALAISHP